MNNKIKKAVLKNNIEGLKLLLKNKNEKISIIIKDIENYNIKTNCVNSYVLLKTYLSRKLNEAERKEIDSVINMSVTNITKINVIKGYFDFFENNEFVRLDSNERTKLFANIVDNNSEKICKDLDRVYGKEIKKHVTNTWKKYKLKTQTKNIKDLQQLKTA